MSRTVESKNFIQRIIYQNLQQDFAIDNFSTLNEKFSIGNISPPDTKYPDIKYFCIGRGGHTTVVGANQSILINFNVHRATDSALFEHIPFVVVPAFVNDLPNDLPNNERLKYRLRKKITINSVDYYAYYLKVLTPTDFTLSNSIIQIEDGKITTNIQHIPTISDLNPTPASDVNTITTVMKGQHFLTQGFFSIRLTVNEVNNIVKACTLIYGDSSYATISEIGIVSGYDETFISPHNDAVTYTEIRTAQIQVFFNLLEILQQDASELNMQFGMTKSIPHPII